MADEPSEPPAPSLEPPQRPWKKGAQDGYTMVTLEVEVCRDEFGRVFSGHQLQDEVDYATVMTWPGGGMEMFSIGLLTEALRREALFGLILKMSQDKDWLARATATPEAKAEAVAELANLVQVQTQRTVEKLSEAVVEEAFAVVLSG